MSCIGTINGTNVIIKQENYKDLLLDIQNHNLIWKIDLLEGVKNLQEVFDYFGLIIDYNDLEGYAEIDIDKGCFEEQDYTDEVLSIIAKYVNDDSFIQIHYRDYETSEKYVFKDKKVKKMIQEIVWKEV